MASKLKSPIDYEALEREVCEAIQADKLYKLQNDAKIRAMEQGVQTYEDFRQLVNGAHLKPLERGDKKPRGGAIWNCVTFKKQEATLWPLPTKKTLIPVKTDVRNITSNACQDFLRTWKTIEGDKDKLSYLWKMRDRLKTQIFHIEIPSTFFNEAITTCLGALLFVDDITSILEILNILGTCSRFSITLSFMSKNERDKCIKLFQGLRAKSHNQLTENAIRSLCAMYQIEGV